MNDENRHYATAARRELILFGILLLAGLTLLPVAVYLVGQSIFGDYPDGLPGFLREIWGHLLAADPATWFLVLSPWLVIAVIRLTWFGLRRPPRRAGGSGPAGDVRKV